MLALAAHASGRQACCFRWRAPQRLALPAAPAARRFPCRHHAPAGAAPTWLCAAAASEEEEAGGSGALLDCEVGPPERRCQPQLAVKDKKVHKATAEALAKQNRLVKFQLGAQGLSAAFLTGCIDALLKHEVVRVKLGGFSKPELQRATALLEATLDCLVVYQIGHTLTLYRQAGLPRPSNLPPLAGAVAGAFEYSYDDERDKRGGAAAPADSAEQKALKQQRKREKAAQDSAAAAKLPPQFQVL